MPLKNTTSCKPSAAFAPLEQATDGYQRAFI
jgi:hypothetical protein